MTSARLGRSYDMRTYDVDRHDNLSMVVRLFIKVVLCSVIEVCEAEFRSQ